MKTRMIFAALALATASAGAPVIAQTSWQSGGNWDRDSFWRGAPVGVGERVDWLQRRIDRGIADGTLDSREARRSQWQLDRIRRDANWMRRAHGRLTSSDRAQLQSRLDELSRTLRWRRHNDGDGSGYRGGGYGADRGQDWRDRQGTDDRYGGQRGPDDGRNYDDRQRYDDGSGYDQ
jgi:hypothetical protein